MFTEIVPQKDNAKTLTYIDQGGFLFEILCQEDLFLCLTMAASAKDHVFFNEVPSQARNVFLVGEQINSLDYGNRQLRCPKCMAVMTFGSKGKTSQTVFIDI